jgi:hypothetical protein
VIAELKNMVERDIMVVVEELFLRRIINLFDAGAVAVLVLEQKSAML